VLFFVVLSARYLLAGRDPLELLRRLRRRAA
jgi:hypothetical protein